LPVGQHAKHDGQEGHHHAAHPAAARLGRRGAPGDVAGESTQDLVEQAHVALLPWNRNRILIA
jgi:hypothetical protein